MSEVTEVTARNLSLIELADRLQDHTDPVVRILIEKLLKQWYSPDLAP